MENKSNHYASGIHEEKQKIEHMLGWDASSGRKEYIAPINYDKEVSLNHIPYLAGRHSVGHRIIYHYLQFFLIVSY